MDCCWVLSGSLHSPLTVTLKLPPHTNSHPRDAKGMYELWMRGINRCVMNGTLYRANDAVIPVLSYTNTYSPWLFTPAGPEPHPSGPAAAAVSLLPHYSISATSLLPQEPPLSCHTIPSLLPPHFLIITNTTKPSSYPNTTTSLLLSYCHNHC